MEMVAHDPKMAKKVGVPQSVGKDFSTADKGKKFGVGGGVNQTQGGAGMVNRQQTRMGSIYGHKKEVPNMSINKYAGLKGGGMAKDMESKAEERKEMKEDVSQDKAMIKKAFKMHDAQEHKGGKGTNLSKLKSGGSVKTSSSRDGIAQRGHTKGKVV